jgi:hypothetical protein
MFYKLYFFLCLHETGFCVQLMTGIKLPIVSC